MGMNAKLHLSRPPRHLLILGDVSGWWTITGEPELRWKGGKNRVHYPVRCRCGTDAVILSQNLRNGLSTSCGCRPPTPTHGYSRTEVYRHWSAMKARCLYASHKHYHHYGGRGITFCEAWGKFTGFLPWALSSGYEDGLTLERVDVNGNYCPENCTWVTQAEQCCNTRRSRMITAFGETKCVTLWERDARCGLQPGILSARLGRGWEPERAITTPPLWRRDDLRKSP